MATHNRSLTRLRCAGGTAEVSGTLEVVENTALSDPVEYESGSPLQNPDKVKPTTRFDTTCLRYLSATTEIFVAFEEDSERIVSTAATFS